MIQKIIKLKSQYSFRQACLGIMVPLTVNQGWNIEKYSKIPPNLVSFSPHGMSVKVVKSASPLMYFFDQEKLVKEFEITGEFKGLPKFTDVLLQGQKGFDDYPLRIGLVFTGEKKLTAFQKIFAPEWVKKIYGNIPDNVGLDFIQFYNVTQNPSELHASRIHPASDLIHENYFALVKESGKFNYQVKLLAPKKVAGIWLSIDGDDTESEFEVDISKLVLSN